jgi:hypothetical protein
MSMPRRIELCFGAAPWLRRAQRLAFLLAVLALGLSPAAWPWRLATLVTLAGAWWFEERRAIRNGDRGRMVLLLDGRVRLDRDGTEQYGLATGVSWVSRWFCVLRLADDDGGRKHSCVVCASENHPDDYRRLLACLRLGAFERRESAA